MKRTCSTGLPHAWLAPIESHPQVEAVDRREESEPGSPPGLHIEDRANGEHRTGHGQEPKKPDEPLHPAAFLGLQVNAKKTSHAATTSRNNPTPQSPL